MGTAIRFFCCARLYPHLIEKKKQALLAYNLLLLVADGKRVGHTPERDKVREIRKMLVEKIWDANQRRQCEIPSWCVEPPPCFEPGWYLRSDIIWAKKNCMPESVTDRPTKAHEHIFLLAKSDRYFYDAEAIKEPVAESSIARVSQNDGQPNWNTERDRSGGAQNEQTMDIRQMVPSDGLRNKRDVWNVATQPFKESHFATFPPDLIAPCVLAGTSEKGCCANCGAPLTRITEKGELAGEAKIQDGERPASEVRGVSKTSALRTNGRTWRQTLHKGWERGCACKTSETKPCVILDPFMGAGTTALVAAKYGRSFIGCELNPAYKEMSERRIAGEVAQEKLL